MSGHKGQAGEVRKEQSQTPVLRLPGSLVFPPWKPSFTHWLEHTIIGKITKPFYYRVQRVCLGPAHISSVFLQTMGHLCIFRLSMTSSTRGKHSRKTEMKAGVTTMHVGSLFPATAILRGCSCLLSYKRKKCASLQPTWRHGTKTDLHST